MRLLLVSTELPLPTRGGSLCLRRLLETESGPEVQVLTHERETFAWPWPVHRARRGRLFYKYWHSRFGTRLQTASLSRGWELPLLPALDVVREIRPAAIVTVAYGPGFVAARRLATRAKLPLVSLFMDWWPDLACNHLQAPHDRHARLEKEFRTLHRASRLSFHFSENMRDELGKGADDRILYPIAGEEIFASSPAGADILAYAGLATGLYAAGVEAVARSTAGRGAARFEISGPGLPDSLARDLPPDTTYHGFSSRDALETRLREATALLVVLPFDAADRRLSRTSFSSKFAEYCRLGRPIIVWGPPDSALARFAAETGSAVLVTTPDAHAVWTAFGELRASPARADSVVAAARQAYLDHFSPRAARDVFHRALASVLPA